MIELCAKLGFDAVDPTGYYFPDYPAVPDDAFIYKIRRRAFLLGLDISGTGVRNDFAAAEQRAADVGLVGCWVDVAAKLGAPNLRVFSGKGVPQRRRFRASSDADDRQIDGTFILGHKEVPTGAWAERALVLTRPTRISRAVH